MEKKLVQQYFGELTAVVQKLDGVEFWMARDLQTRLGMIAGRTSVKLSKER